MEMKRTKKRKRVKMKCGKVFLQLKQIRKFALHTKFSVLCGNRMPILSNEARLLFQSRFRFVFYAYIMHRLASFSQLSTFSCIQINIHVSKKIVGQTNEPIGWRSSIYFHCSQRHRNCVLVSPRQVEVSPCR